MAYSFTLLAHSWNRWAVLCAGVGLLAYSAILWRNAAAWSAHVERLHKVFLGLMDMQLVLGLLLFLFLSPVTAVGFVNMGDAMSVASVRFFTLEHPMMMILAITVAHIGRVVSKRRAGRERAKVVVAVQAFWLLVTMASIPWPGLRWGRVLFRSPTVFETLSFSLY